MAVSTEEKDRLFLQFRQIMGAPIRQIEIEDEQLCTILEISIETYSQYVSEYLIENKWLSFFGQKIDTIDMAFALDRKSVV